MAPSKTKVWILANRPKGLATYQGEDNATFELKEEDLPPLKDDEVLVKTLYLSNDPAQRGWISGNIPQERMYAPIVEIGEPMRARGLVEIIESKSSSYKPGDVASVAVGWREYAVVPAKECMPCRQEPGLPLEANLGAFGMVGMTAYYGLVVIGGAKKGDKITVSGAAGATGSLVVQIAKHIIGCKTVIGIAGRDDKCRWVESLGADKCLNYKSQNFKQELKEAAKDSDVYFDNVGGDILDQMLVNVKRHGSVAVCGSIAAYNTEEATVLKNWFQVISMRIKLQGFIVSDNAANFKETAGILMDAYKNKKLKIDEKSTHVESVKIEDIPKVWLMLFEGGNQGKLLTKLQT